MAISRVLREVLLELEGKYSLKCDEPMRYLFLERYLPFIISIGGPKMSGNFVRERQRIVYIYNIHVYYICKQYVAARAQNFQTFLGRLCYKF